MTSSAQLQTPAFSIPRSGLYATPAVVQSEIKTFAAKTNHLADQILSQNEPKAYTGPVIIHDHHYYQPYPMFWYDPGPRYVVINNGHCADDRRREDNGAAVIIGILSAIVAGVALYSLGSSIAAYQDSNQELTETFEFQGMLNSNPTAANPKEQQRIDEAYQVAHLKGRICTRIKHSAISDIFLKTALFSAAAISLTGAFATAPALMTAGMVGGLVVGGGMLFKWGLDSTDKSNIRDALAIKDRIQNLN
jgi:hypothetical protein